MNIFFRMADWRSFKQSWRRSSSG